MKRTKRQFGLAGFIPVAALLGVAVFHLEISAQEKTTGTIQGVVKNKWLMKYPMLVYIEKWKDAKFETSATNPVMNQKGKRFDPYILPVLKGTIVTFRNSDSFDHNTFSPDGEKYDLGTWGKNDERKYRFDKAGVYTQLCRLHPEMIAYVVVLDAPYWAVVEAKSDGTFKIPNVPAGKYELKVWCERFQKKSLEKTFPVEVAAGKATTVTLEP